MEIKCVRCKSIFLTKWDVDVEKVVWCPACRMGMRWAPIAIFNPGERPGEGMTRADVFHSKPRERGPDTLDEALTSAEVKERQEEFLKKTAKEMTELAELHDDVTSDPLLFTGLAANPAPGLMPEKIHREKRVVALLEAMARKIQAGEKVLHEWVLELDDYEFEVDP